MREVNFLRMRPDIKEIEQKLKLKKWRYLKSLHLWYLKWISEPQNWLYLKSNWNEGQTAEPVQDISGTQLVTYHCSVASNLSAILENPLRNFVNNLNFFFLVLCFRQWVKEAKKNPSLNTSILSNSGIWWMWFNWIWKYIKKKSLTPSMALQMLQILQIVTQ